MNKICKKIICIALFFGIISCKHEPLPAEEIEVFMPDPTIGAEVVYPQEQYEIRTPDGANALDLETPLRCNVNWKTQQMVLTLPFNNSAFLLQRTDPNDKLPRFEVTGFTFETMPAEKALYKLTKEAGITLTAEDAPYASLSGDDLKGEFSDVINMITQAAEIYYSYNEETKVKIGRAHV